MTVTATSDTAGTATIENETTGKSVSKTFSGNVEGSLCRTDAEWIVEDVSLSLSPLHTLTQRLVRVCRAH